MRLHICLIAAALVSMPARGAVVFVDQSNVSGTEDGLTWATAFTAVQPAVDVAMPGDEVWVASGTYDELRNAVNGALILREGISLYGGFAGGETAIDQRGELGVVPSNPFSLKTWQTGAKIRSFHEARDAVTDFVTILDGTTSRSGGPAHHVVVAAQGTLLDGFTIRGGKATAGGATGNYGGGLLIAGVDVTVRNCVFEANEALFGGAIGHLTGGFAEVSDTVFRDNAAGSFGGAIHEQGVSSYSGCAFQTNNALMGGAVAVYDGSTLIQRCVFDDNRALVRDGGALWVNLDGVAELDAIQFTGNIAETDGGAVANWSGTVNIRNTVFRDNRATRAGGAVITLGPTRLTHCTVWKNSAKTDSAAVVSSGGSITAVNSDFRGNTPASILNLSALKANVTYSNVEGGFVGEGNMDAGSKYRDPDGGDFRLLPSSPLIDTGTSVDDVTSDYRGIPRPAGLGFDIGAAEFFDSDGDLMEDDWEEQFGFDPDDPDDGETDADGDELSNAREFELDTDPTNPHSPPRELFVAKAGDDANPGTEAAPFQTIGRALDAARLFGNALAIQAGPGLFEEQIVLPPGVLLRGAGAAETEIRHFNAEDVRHVVVEIGEGARVEDCRISLPPLQAGLGVLASMRNVSGVLERVTLDGGDSLFSIGVSVQGAASSNAEISNCRIRRVQVGIQTLDSGVNISRNTFEGVRGDAVLVNLPDGKTAAPPHVPVLGLGGVPDTGGNVFGSVVGYFLVNLTDSRVAAENNNWGMTDPVAISRKMFGPVDFRPIAGEKVYRFFACGTAAPSNPIAGDVVAVIVSLVLVMGLRRRRPNQR